MPAVKTLNVRECEYFTCREKKNQDVLVGQTKEGEVEEIVSLCFLFEIKISTFQKVHIVAHR